MIALTSLERFARLSAKAHATPKCELCSAPLAEAHRHVVDRTERRVLCACTACYCAFDGPIEGRFRAVSGTVRRARGVDVEHLTDLGVPVGLAFFFRSSTVGRWFGLFPSPAGPTEAELPQDAWERLAAASEEVRGVADDIEALLVRTARDKSVDAFVVPIDVCYELTALVRQGWRSIDGGDEGRQILDSFFARLGERAS